MRFISGAYSLQMGQSYNTKKKTAAPLSGAVIGRCSWPARSVQAAVESAAAAGPRVPTCVAPVPKPLEQTQSTRQIRSTIYTILTLNLILTYKAILAFI